VTALVRDDLSPLVQQGYPPSVNNKDAGNELGCDRSQPTKTLTGQRNPKSGDRSLHSKSMPRDHRVFWALAAQFTSNH